MRTLLLLLLSVASLGLAPPHPKAGKDVHERYRRMLGQDSPSRPNYQLVNPQLCHGLTEEECLEMDERFVENARKLRSTSTKTGFLRVLVLCMRFTDHELKPLPNTTILDRLFNSPVPFPHAPAGSVKNFVEQNSLGALRVEFDVMPWLLTDNTENHYSFNISGLTQAYSRSFHPVLDQLEALGTDWSRYDSDGDGAIDAAIALHSGYQAEIGRPDCWAETPVEGRIWSHAMGSLVASSAWTSPSTGIALDNYATTNANRGICDNRMSFPGILTHEFLHLFGLLDVNDNAGDFIGRGMGHYSIMSNGFGVDNKDTHPTHLSPWEKIWMGWLKPIEIVGDGTYFLGPSENTSDVYVIKKNFPDDEYLLIENRQPIGFDSQLWNGGILIWHIDDTKIRMRERGYPGQTGWPGNNRHYQIAVVQADGQYHLEKGVDGGNMGDDGDFYRDGMQIGPWVVEEEASLDGIYPNTNSYRFGEIAQTGIRLFNFSASSTIMSFSVEGLGPGQPTEPLSTSIPSTSTRPSIAPAEEPATSPMSKPPESFQPTSIAASSSVPSSMAPSIGPLDQIPSLPSSSTGPSIGPSDQPSNSATPSTSRIPSIAPSLKGSASFVPSDSQSSSMTPSIVPPKPPSTSNAPLSWSPSTVPSDLPSFSLEPSFVPSDLPSFVPTTMMPTVPNIPDWSSICRAAGEPCDYFLHCCSKRCYHGGLNVHSYCLPQRDTAKDALKLDRSDI